MKVFKFFIGFLLLVIFTYFAASNTHIVPIYLLGHPNSNIEQPADPLAIEPPEIKEPLQFQAFALVYLCFGLGFLTAWILNAGFRRSLKKEIKKLQKVIRGQEKELDKLRNLPISGTADELSSEPPQLPLKNE
ncbi:LapA family protein [bacterium]|nr:LapA family protein [candidate division CSSED10-310 bacterium]